jgi:hypothetical protein
LTKENGSALGVVGRWLQREATVARLASLTAIGFGVSLEVWSIFSAQDHPLTARESAIVQAFGWAVGIYASWQFGRSSLPAAAKELVKRQVRSAFRRTKDLYGSAARLSSAVDERRDALRGLKNQTGDVALTDVELALDLLHALVNEQIGRLNDALEDWRDLVPEEIERMDREIAERISAARVAGAPVGESAPHQGEGNG